MTRYNCNTHGDLEHAEPDTAGRPRCPECMTMVSIHDDEDEASDAPTPHDPGPGDKPATNGAGGAETGTEAAEADDVPIMGLGHLYERDIPDRYDSDGSDNSDGTTDANEPDVTVGGVGYVPADDKTSDNATDQPDGAAEPEPEPESEPSSGRQRDRDEPEPDPDVPAHQTAPTVPPSEQQRPPSETRDEWDDPPSTSAHTPERDADDTADASGPRFSVGPTHPEDWALGFLAGASAVVFAVGVALLMLPTLPAQSLLATGGILLGGLVFQGWLAGTGGEVGA